MALSEDQQRQTREIAWEVADVIATRFATEVTTAIRLHASECQTAKDTIRAEQVAREALSAAAQVAKDLLEADALVAANALAHTERHAATCDVKKTLEALVNQGKGVKSAAAIVAAVISFLIGVAAFVIGIAVK